MLLIQDVNLVMTLKNDERRCIQMFITDCIIHQLFSISISNLIIILIYSEKRSSD